MNSPVADKQLNALKLICFALPTGAGLFTIIAFFLGSEEQASSIDITTLRLILLIVTAVVFFTQQMLKTRILSGKQSMKSGDNSFINRYYTSSIIQLAMAEGITLFSAVILMMIPPSVKAADTTSYIHVLPLFWLVLVARSIYPSAEKLEALQQQYQPAS